MKSIFAQLCAANTVKCFSVWWFMTSWVILLEYFYSVKLSICFFLACWSSTSAITYKTRRMRFIIVFLSDTQIVYMSIKIQCHHTNCIDLVSSESIYLLLTDTSIIFFYCHYFIFILNYWLAKKLTSTTTKETRIFPILIDRFDRNQF